MSALLLSGSVMKIQIAVTVDGVERAVFSGCPGRFAPDGGAKQGSRCAVSHQLTSLMRSMVALCGCYVAKSGLGFGSVVDREKGDQGDKMGS